MAALNIPSYAVSSVHGNIALKTLLLNSSYFTLHCSLHMWWERLCFIYLFILHKRDVTEVYRFSVVLTGCWVEAIVLGIMTLWGQFSVFPPQTQNFSCPCSQILLHLKQKSKDRCVCVCVCVCLWIVYLWHIKPSEVVLSFMNFSYSYCRCTRYVTLGTVPVVNSSVKKTWMQNLETWTLVGGLWFALQKLYCELLKLTDSIKKCV